MASPRFADLSGRPLFSVDGTTYSWGDALTAAELRGSTDALERQTRRSLDCLSRLEVQGDAPSDEDVHAAARQFRYDRDLLAADELEAWLIRWCLTTEEWTAHLRRALALERCENGRAGGEADGLAVEGLDAALQADAACSGFLQTEAGQFAIDVALGQVDGPDLTSGATGLDGRRSLIERILDSSTAARAGLASEQEVDREIANRALDWTRIEAESLQLSDADAAREAALCMMVDGQSMEAVAADCGATPQRLDTLLEDAAPELRVSLTSARPGETFGPVSVGGSFVIVQVVARRRPANEDPYLRQRARAAVVARHVEAELRRRVHWLDHF